MSFKNPTTAVKMKDVNGLVLEGQTGFTADFYSSWVNPGNADFIGVAVDLSAFAGTSETLNMILEITMDSGASTVVTFRYPDAANSPTLDNATTNQAALTQIPDGDTDSQSIGYWRNIVPQRGAGSARVRLFFNVANTVTALTVDSAYWIFIEGNA